MAAEGVEEAVYRIRRFPVVVVMLCMLQCLVENREAVGAVERPHIPVPDSARKN
jgi:hypothetical protein